MRISVHHQLKIDLGTGHPHCVQQILLTPRSGTTQTVADWTVSMSGMDKAARFTDAYGNIAHLVSQFRGQGELAITVEGVVETLDRNGVLGRPRDEPVPALYRRLTELTQPDESLVEPYRDGKTKRLAVLHALMDKLAEAPELASGQSQTQSQMQADGQLQVQAQGDDPQSEGRLDAADLAHRFVGAARGLQIPARYVTGYLWAEDETTSFHAWAEAYDDALGWVGFDPSLGLCPTDRHIRIAAGLDAATTLPVRSFPEGGPLTVVGLSVAAPSAQ